MRSQVYMNCTGCVIAPLQHFVFLFQWRRYRLPFVSYSHLLAATMTWHYYQQCHIRAFVEVQQLVTAQNNSRCSTKVRSKSLVG